MWIRLYMSVWIYCEECDLFVFLLEDVDHVAMMLREKLIYNIKVVLILLLYLKNANQYSLV